MSTAKTILTVKDITKKFGGLTAVNSVNMYVNKGEIVGLIGANGAGKTTLFNMIAGAFPPTSGKIIFNGKEIQGLPPHKICKLRIGRTYQIVQPFRNLSLIENVMVGSLLRHSNVNEAKAKAEAVCELVGLKDKMYSSGGALTLGELKRLELARALATEPELLLLDEVMAGLNPSENAEVVELIREIRNTGVTIVVIEHVMKAIMSLSDRIYVLNQGVCIAEGSPSEVSSNPEVIRSYLGGGYSHAENR